MRGAAIDEARRSSDWMRFVFLHDPAHWIDVFEQHAAQMDDSTFWRVLRHIYSSLDTTTSHHGRLARLFVSRPVEVALRIDPADADFFHALPDPMKIYRGYADPHSRGFSWTLSLRIAKFFAYRAQERSGDQHSRPQVLTGLAQKKDVVTLVRFRNEAEVVIDPKLVTQKQRRSLGPLRGSLEDLIA
jgi:hypothetical protein